MLAIARLSTFESSSANSHHDKVRQHYNFKVLVSFSLVVFSVAVPIDIIRTIGAYLPVHDIIQLKLTNSHWKNTLDFSAVPGYKHKLSLSCYSDFVR